MEQNKLPKNIRQIGEKEDWIRVYIEDYVHTYIQRLRGLQEGGISGGVLLGKRQRINGIMHLFIRGAVVAQDPFWRDPAQTPGQLKAESSVYFPELEICGFFISSRQNRSSEVDLVRIFETHFPSEYQVLFNVRDQEEEVFSYSGHGLIRLAGYYIYYEKNEEMQSYIIRQESLRVMEGRSGADVQGVPVAEKMPGQSAGRTEKNGKTGKRIFGGNGKTQGDSGNMKEGTGPNARSGERGETAGKKPASGKKMQKGDAIVRIVSIAGIFILAFLLFSDQIKFSRISETTESESGILSSILNNAAAVPAGADSSYIESGAGGESVNDNNGNAAESENTGESGENGNETEGGDEAESKNAVGGTVQAGDVTGSETGDGTENEKENETAVNGTVGENEAANANVFPMKYLVKKGDSLYSICEKYYGDTGMVDAVCLENDISDPSKLKYGIILTLPAR